MKPIPLDTLRGKIAGERLTQDDFADILGITRQSMSNKLNGRNQFTALEMAKISNYFKEKGKPYLVNEIMPELFI